MFSYEKHFKDKVVVVTGGGGVLCSTIAEALSDCGASIAILDIRKEAAEEVTNRLKEKGGKVVALRTDVTDKPSVEKACKKILDIFGKVDILINGAGGNDPRASTSSSLSFFDIPQKSFEKVVNLNLLGTVIPSQVFGEVMAKRGVGVMLNFSSMNAIRPLTRIPAYSAAKGGVSNFTQWLAVHISHNYSKKIRVNALAPGFFITKQTRFLLMKEDGEPTSRGKAVIDHTPIGRFGEPKDLVGIVLFLLSDQASFIHGAVIPVDGGFSVYSGV
jgi:NAD(P)-dependent dehydrogenase (short-subunit alcohol dehydrogenase family)